MNINTKILRLQEVRAITGLSKSTIYDLCSKNAFPSRVNITARTVGWVSSEIYDWVNARISKRTTTISGASGATI